MTKPVICDRCDARIDTAWTRPALTVENTTGTGGPSKIHLCTGCHTDVRNELYPLLVPNGEYEHPEEL